MNKKNVEFMNTIMSVTTQYIDRIKILQKSWFLPALVYNDGLQANLNSFL